MSRSTTTVYVIGMSLLGIVLLALVGWLLDVRLRHTVVSDIAPVGTSGAPPHTGSGAVGALAGGIGATMRQAAASLSTGPRADAVSALDAALRVSEVAHEAVPAEPAFEEALAAVREARRSLQNGRPHETLPGALLAQAQRLFSLDLPDTALAVPPNGTRYEGAVVLDATGRMVGELESFSASSGDTAVFVRTGGWPDFMGLFDIGGDLQRVRATDLVFGPARTVGSTLVVWLPADGRETPVPAR